MTLKKYFQSWEAIMGEWEGLDIVTACTIYDPETGKVARGVAVCSPGDEPDEKKGVFQAECYAKRALKNRGNTDITDRRAIQMMLCTECAFTKHVDMWPTLSLQEHRALFGKKKMMEIEPMPSWINVCVWNDFNPKKTADEFYQRIGAINQQINTIEGR